jgi:hypothetical protein
MTQTRKIIPKNANLWNRLLLSICYSLAIETGDDDAGARALPMTYAYALTIVAARRRDREPARLSIAQLSVRDWPQSMPLYISA